MAHCTVAPSDPLCTRVAVAGSSPGRRRRVILTRTARTASRTPSWTVCSTTCTASTSSRTSSATWHRRSNTTSSPTWRTPGNKTPGAKSTKCRRWERDEFGDVDVGILRRCSNMVKGGSVVGEICCPFNNTSALMMLLSRFCYFVLFISRLSFKWTYLRFTRFAFLVFWSFMLFSFIEIIWLLV